MLGLRSTAIRFGDNTMTWVGSFYAGAIVLWLLAGYLAGTHLIFFMAVVLASLQMAWQVTTLDMSDARQLPAPLPLQPRCGSGDLPGAGRRHGAVPHGGAQLSSWHSALSNFGLDPCRGSKPECASLAVVFRAAVWCDHTGRMTHPASCRLKR